jgi:hypothetical protein
VSDCGGELNPPVGSQNLGDQLLDSVFQLAHGEMDVCAGGTVPIATKETVNSKFVWVPISNGSVDCWFVWVLKSRAMGYFI